MSYYILIERKFTDSITRYCKQKKNVGNCYITKTILVIFTGKLKVIKPINQFVLNR